MRQCCNLAVLLMVVYSGSLPAVTAELEDAKAIARLYSAAFDRTPKVQGLNFWVGAFESGLSLVQIADAFYESPEFTNRYGLLNDGAYIRRLFRNILHREGHPQGIAFWENHLADGVSRATVLAEFAGSDENVAKTTEAIAGLELVEGQWVIQAPSSESGAPGKPVPARPNILMIAVDDLNAWVGHLNTHPNTLTPNIDQLASEGVSFASAYAPGISCKPSRTAVLTGLHPVSSGIFDNTADESSLLEDTVTLPRYFEQHGYYTLATGKLFHLPNPEQFTEYSWGNGDYIWENEEYTPAHRQNGVDRLWDALDWGPISTPDASTPDMMRASWAAAQLKRSFEKPFFLSIGIYRPHLSWYLPKHYFDKFPLSSLQLPPGALPGDLLDVKPGGQMGSHWTHQFLVEANAWYEAVQAYLASINYADAAVGVVLDALDASPYRENTIVVLWGDHGWQLGEKERWSKETLWATSTRTTLVMRGPGLDNNGIIDTPVSLMSLFPTLVELSGLPPNTNIEAPSLVAVVNEDAQGAAVLSSISPTEHALRWENWSYFSHPDGSEQFYDMAEDPHEWVNLVTRREFKEPLMMMRERLRESVR